MNKGDIMSETKLQKIKTLKDFESSIDEINKNPENYILAPDFYVDELIAGETINGRKYYNNRWYEAWTTLLDNTLAQLKTKSAKMNFIENILREIGKRIKYDKTKNEVLYDNSQSLHSALKSFVTYLHVVAKGLDFYRRESTNFKSIDARLVYCLAGSSYPEEFPLKNVSRFDPENPLHQKLARIAMTIEEGWVYFKGITERWERDTAPQKVLLEKAQNEILNKANVKNIETLKKLKSGQEVSVDDIIKLSADDFKHINPLHDLKKLKLEELNKVRNKKFDVLSPEQNFSFVYRLIELAPVNKEWFEYLGGRFRYGWSKCDRSLPNFDTWNKTLTAFNKKFAPMKEVIEESLKTATENDNKAKEKLNQVEAEYKKLFEKQKQKQNYTKWIKDIKESENLFKEICIDNDRLSKREKNFYSQYYNLLKDIKKNPKIGHGAEIEGHPWVIFGTQTSKSLLIRAKNLFSDLVKLYEKNIYKWTNQDEKELSELNMDIRNKQRTAEESDNQAKQDLRDAKEIKKLYDDIRASTEYVDKHKEKVKEKFKSKSHPTDTSKYLEFEKMLATKGK